MHGSHKTVPLPSRYLTWCEKYDHVAMPATSSINVRDHRAASRMSEHLGGDQCVQRTEGFCLLAVRFNFLLSEYSYRDIDAPESSDSPDELPMLYRDEL